MRCPSHDKLSVHLLEWLRERELYSSSFMLPQVVNRTGHMTYGYTQLYPGLAAVRCHSQTKLPLNCFGAQICRRSYIH